MATQVPLINGTAYDWASIKIQILGVTVYGVSAINYGVTQEKTNNMGAGTEPVSRGRGGKEYSASLTLEMKEIRRIQAALPAGSSLLDIPPFPIVVQYLVGTNLVTDVVNNAEFTQQVVDTSQGDSTINMEMPLAIAGIVWGS